MSYIQTVKDWHLLLLSVGIIMIDVVYIIPLLTLIYVMGSGKLEIDIENPSFTNVSGLYFHCTVIWFFVAEAKTWPFLILSLAPLLSLSLHDSL